MMRHLGLLLLFVSLTGCGRGTVDLYRAYNLTPMRDSAGKPVSDLATQNRLSLQTGIERSYFYVVPDQTTAPDPDADPAADATGKSPSDLEARVDEISEAIDDLLEDEAATEEASEEEGSEEEVSEPETSDAEGDEVAEETSEE